MHSQSLLSFVLCLAWFSIHPNYRIRLPQRYSGSSTCVRLNSPGAFSLASDLKSIHAESHNQTNNKFHSRYASQGERERESEINKSLCWNAGAHELNAVKSVRPSACVIKISPCESAKPERDRR